MAVSGGGGSSSRQPSCSGGRIAVGESESRVGLQVNQWDLKAKKRRVQGVCWKGRRKEGRKKKERKS